jgi:hypothetical protein
MAFDMSDYVDVRHRLELALLQYPDLRVVEAPPHLREIGERLYIECCVTVYRSHDDPTPGRAYCWEVWPGRTPYTKDSEQMNGATSALGRALGYMGFGIKSGLASADEVRTAQGNSHPATQPPDTPRRPVAGNNSRPASSNSGGTITGLASSKQLDLIATMRKERNLDAWDATDKTFNDASDEITRLKGIPR